MFDALAAVEGPLFFCYPNADSGSRELIERAHRFISERGNGQVFVNLEPVLYWSLLQYVDFLIGNSSSGIMEAASFALPAINVGIRQRGREYGRNVLQTPADAAAIIDSVRTARGEAFRKSLAGMENPYGDGNSSQRIVKVLEAVPLGEQLLLKRQVAVRKADFP